MRKSSSTRVYVPALRRFFNVPEKEARFGLEFKIMRAINKARAEGFATQGRAQLCKS